MDAFFRFAKQNFVREHRFAQMRQKPAVPSQSSRNSFLSKFLVRRQPQ